MKTQVIQLDAHDDVISVRDKMSWAKTPRILLVFPRRARILARTLDLRLLKRHGVTLGAQLAIVARSADLRRSAQAAGLPVFQTVTSAQRDDWEKENQPEPPRRRSPRPDLRQMRRETFPPEARWRSNLALRFTFFVLAVLAILALLAVFIPSATIELTPETRMQNLTVSVSASLDVNSVNVAGSIPARLIFTQLEQSKTATVTGSVDIPDAPASGTVRFRNLTTGLVGIPAGTVVRTLGDAPVRFATTLDAVAAAGVGKTVDIPVQALEAGASGNLPADTLVAMEGDLGASLSVTNPAPTTGGADRLAPVQTADDRVALRAALVAGILAECKTALPPMLAAGDLIFPGTMSISQVLTETYFPPDGQPGEALSLTLNVQCQAQYASADDLNLLAKLALDANLPPGFEPTSGGAALPDFAAPITGVDGVTRWDVQVERVLRARVDSLEAAQLVLGRTPNEAVRRLAESLPLADAPTVQLKPSWWPWLPVIPFQIDVKNGN